MNELENYLKQIGVKHIHFGCGARNESLVEKLSSFEQFFYFDERVASFTALGQAKYLKQPVAVCVTSGTAVSECFSAVIEAYYSQIPLIIISADRPKRLWETYAPQTIQHEGLFSKYIRSEVYDLSINHTEFPMHINYIIDDRKVEKYDRIIPLNQSSAYHLIKKANQSVIVLTHDHLLTLSQIRELDSLGYCFYIEVTADLDESLITNQISEKDLIAQIKSKNVDLLIKFGSTPLSKIWREADRGNLDISILSIGKYPLGLADGFICDEYFKFPQNSNAFNLSNDFIFESIRKDSEFFIYQDILKKIGTASIYVGNSMPIRYLQILSSRKNKIYASRGVNGIDGQISTAIGMAIASPLESFHCLIGDLTFLYDFNSLFHTFPKNLTLHIVNNNGGGIFKQVPANKAMMWKHSIDIENIIKELNMSEQIHVYQADPEQTELDWKEYREM